jgi:hypothetical protein
LQNKDLKAALLFTAIFPVVLHHVIFFNFTAEHEFSTLKEAPLIAIVAGLLASRLWLATIRGSHWRMRVLVLASLAGFFAVAVWQYRVLVGPYITGYKEIGDYIFREARPDEIIFLKSEQPNRPTDEPFPQMIFYAHRNIDRWQDEVHARDLARRNGVSRGIIFTLNRDETKVIEHKHIILERQL